jgi:hypothetical protein
MLVLDHYLQGPALRPATFARRRGDSRPWGRRLIL